MAESKLAISVFTEVDLYIILFKKTQMVSKIYCLALHLNIVWNIVCVTSCHIYYVLHACTWKYSNHMRKSMPTCRHPLSGQV